jgi:hypothetical protein
MNNADASTATYANAVRVLTLARDMGFPLVAQ